MPENHPSEGENQASFPENHPSEPENLRQMAKIGQPTPEFHP
jgi:hypothetical protein